MQRAINVSTLGPILLASFCACTVSTQAFAQVVFQPPDCEFRTVFVIPPDIKEVTGTDEDGQPYKSAIANLEATVDGQPNFFRADCTKVKVPKQLDQAFFLEDMKTIASGNGFKNPTTWVEKDSSGNLVGRVRGQITDTSATFVVDVRRFFGKSSMLDVWVGSPPNTFPSQGNLIFLKEIKLNGKPVY